MLPLTPCTVTIPVSGGGGGGPPPLPPPQLSIAVSKHASRATSATCRAQGLHSKDCEARRRSMIRTISRQAVAKAATGHPVNGRFFCGVGKVDAEDEAVTVTVAVLLLLRAPTEQVTPASELDGVQVKVTLAEKSLIGFKVSVDVWLVPGFIVKKPGEAISQKPGAPVLKLNTLDHAAFWPLPEGARAWTSQ